MMHGWPLAAELTCSTGVTRKLRSPVPGRGNRKLAHPADSPGLTVVRGGDKLNFPAVNPALNSQRIQTQFEGLRRKYGYGTGSTRLQEFH
jgi:hypothetical protein